MHALFALLKSNRGNENLKKGKRMSKTARKRLEAQSYLLHMLRDVARFRRISQILRPFSDSQFQFKYECEMEELVRN